MTDVFFDEPQYQHLYDLASNDNVTDQELATAFYGTKMLREGYKQKAHEMLGQSLYIVAMVKWADVSSSLCCLQFVPDSLVLTSSPPCEENIGRHCMHPIFLFFAIFSPFRFWALRGMRKCLGRQHCIAFVR